MFINKRERMEIMDSDNVLSSRLTEKVQQGTDTMGKLSRLKIEGIQKLQNKFKQELNFLNKILKNKQVKEEHLNCSNLSHLQAISSMIFDNQQECIHVMSNKTFRSSNGGEKRICIDLILNGGAVWMKVTARNAAALSLVSTGEGSYGQKSILDQAQEFMECAQQNLHYFKAPRVIFTFVNGINEDLVAELESIGIEVQQCSPLVNQQNLISTSDYLPEVHSEVDHLPMVKCPLLEYDIERNYKIISEMSNLKLNLGVTTLIAYVSALTNGGCHYHFNTDVLNQHAEWERARPVRPVLDKLFYGRKLYACQSAIDDFHKILHTLGGKTEKERAKELLARIEVVEDKPTNKLQNCNKMKYRSLAIFGTGDYLQAITVSANHAFVRSALNQGINFAVFLHESRALTEGKQPGYHDSS